MKVGKNSWLLSALGQKQTFAPQKAMSALPPKAECAVQLGMSALCQKQTYAVQQFTRYSVSSSAVNCISLKRLAPVDHRR